MKIDAIVTGIILVVILVTIGESVEMGVVDERVVAISPGEFLEIEHDIVSKILKGMIKV